MDRPILNPAAFEERGGEDRESVAAEALATTSRSTFGIRPHFFRHLKSEIYSMS